MNSQRPRISIVIPTYNRREKLNRLLQSIEDAQISQSYEVIVVDDSEAATSINEEIRSSLSGSLHHMKNPVRRFISSAKNIGWKNARGEYVFFIDDDNILPRGTAEALFETLEANPGMGALMPIVYYEKKRNLVWVYAAPFAEGRWKFDLLGRNELEREKPRMRLLPTDALPNASMVRREVLERVGGLDESLPINSSCDLCQRIKGAGYQVFALSSAEIFHDVTLPGTAGYWAEHASEDFGRRYYEVRDWFDLMSRLHRGEVLLPLKEFIRSLSFLIPVSSGILLHPTRRKQSVRRLYLSMLRGLRDGVKISASSDAREVEVGSA